MNLAIPQVRSPRPPAVSADRAELTRRYLDAVAASGARGSDLLAVMPADGLIADMYGRQYLSRPLFLGSAERDQLTSDLVTVRGALLSIPDRLFNGDLAAFGEAAGMTAPQVDAVLRTRGGQVTQLARADLYPSHAGLRLLEYNMGSGIAGTDIADICRLMLRHPVLRGFARENRLSYADTMDEHVKMIFDETAVSHGSHPVVALIDWPEHYAIIGEPLRKLTRRWRTRGLDAHAGHLGELKVSGGRVRLRGRPVDIVFRLFLTSHLLEPGGSELMDPIIGAVARGEVALFTPMDAELFGSKAALAMLSDEANRHLLSDAECAALDRILPWTRMARPGPVTLEDGSTVDLAEYALRHPGDLVLKPTLLHGGRGVLPGWHDSVTPQAWRDAVTGAMGGPYVLQRRIDPLPELCPGEDGDLVPWIVTWGVFTLKDRYGGVFARAFPVDSGMAVQRVGSHVYVGCCLTQD